MGEFLEILVDNISQFSVIHKSKKLHDRFECDLLRMDKRA